MIINKYHPKIIGITGSVGKTGAKEAIVAVIKSKFRVRSSDKNYNNEIGVPLTIIGAESGKSSIWGWLKVFWRAKMLILFHDRNYPEVLVLEMGADKPGDISYLTSIAPCDIGVLTNIGEAHMEFFGSQDNILKEKQIILTRLAKAGLAIVNIDDPLIFKIKDKIKAKNLTVSINKKANIVASEVANTYPVKIGDNYGVRFKISYNGSIVPFILPQVLGDYQVYSALLATAVGIGFGLNLVEIAKALREWNPPNGRMRVLSGIKNSWLIDDSYNASPKATSVAVKTLSEFPTGHFRIAVLGDMLELGNITEIEHKKIGKLVAEVGIDKLVAVGERARFIIEGALKQGMPSDYCFHFDNSDEAKKFVQELIQEGDVILIKGSQGARMEKIVKEVMGEPERSSELLVRQGKEWLRK